MFNRLLGKDKEVDLTNTTFDPANSAHLASLSNQISSFNKVAWGLFKTDVVNVAPISLSLLLCVGNVYGYITEGIILTACVACIWASNQWHQRVTQSAACQVELKQLLSIYEKCIADHGYQIMSNESMLELLKTIAPYVPTYKLWYVKANNPADYPEGFKKILSAPPHSIPFGESKVAETPTLIENVSSLLTGTSQGTLVLSQVSAQVSNLSIFNLLHKIVADVKQTVYCYKG